jgi:hypothetical protein
MPQQPLHAHTIGSLHTTAPAWDMDHRPTCSRCRGASYSTSPPPNWLESLYGSMLWLSVCNFCCCCMLDPLKETEAFLLVLISRQWDQLLDGFTWHLTWGSIMLMIWHSVWTCSELSILSVLIILTSWRFVCKRCYSRNCYPQSQTLEYYHFFHTSSCRFVHAHIVMRYSSQPLFSSYLGVCHVVWCELACLHLKVFENGFENSNVGYKVKLNGLPSPTWDRCAISYQWMPSHQPLLAEQCGLRLSVCGRDPLMGEATTLPAILLPWGRLAQCW